jgi:hypothetical protein
MFLTDQRQGPFNMTRHHWNLVLGLAALAFSLTTLFLLIPVGVESGVIEEVRRQTVIGDGMAPTVWSISLGALGLLLALGSWLRVKEAVPEPSGGGPSAQNMGYLALLLLIVSASLALMTLAGPLAVKVAQVMGSDVESYRVLRDTRPWKYLGYVLGGFLLIFGLMSYISHCISWRLALVSITATVLMAMAYDLPFDNLLLPPNGDQQ